MKRRTWASDGRSGMLRCSTKKRQVVDMMELCPQDVKKLFIQRAREGAVEELGGQTRV